MFELHQNFASKIEIGDLPLSKVLLENNSFYPWIILVPKVEGVSKIMDLKFDDQVQLLKEMNTVQECLWSLFSPKQLNVAAIGNKTPQLHIHLIARFENDPAWPGTVWDHPAKKAYSNEEISSLLNQIRKKLFDE